MSDSFQVCCMLAPKDPLQISHEIEKVTTQYENGQNFCIGVETEYVWLYIEESISTCFGFRLKSTSFCFFMQLDNRFGGQRGGKGVVNFILCIFVLINDVKLV